MAKETDRKIKEKDIVGLKYFDQLGEKLKATGSDARLKDLQHTLTLVDGGIFEASKCTSIARSSRAC